MFTQSLDIQNQNIHDADAANLAALADSKTAIYNYSVETIKPRTAVSSSRKTATANLAALFKETDDILKNQMDKLIELYRADHSDFVNTYFETRIIVDPPTRSRKAEGKVDGENEVSPIKDF